MHAGRFSSRKAIDFTANFDRTLHETCGKYYEFKSDARKILPRYSRQHILRFIICIVLNILPSD